VGLSQEFLIKLCPVYREYIRKLEVQILIRTRRRLKNESSDLAPPPPLSSPRLELASVCPLNNREKKE
jgi:hypothetical protein